MPALSHSYDLWAVGGHPLPWRNWYAAQFWLWYRCDVADGETLLVESAAALDLDRPVTTDGTPVRTPISRGTTLLRRLDGTTTVFLAGLVTAEVRHQFALRNALVWTKSPAYVLVTGGLLDARSVRGGEAVVPLPVLGWAPFPPDPYVSNTILTGPAVRDDVAVREVMVARIRWTTPDAVTVSFDGSLGTSLAVERAVPSDGDPRPARRNQEGPAILTQTQQHTAHPDPAGQAAVKKARAAADRVVRLWSVPPASRMTRACARLDATLRETVGWPPALLLLDVSSNQDLLGVAIGARGIRDEHRRRRRVHGLGSDRHRTCEAMRVVSLPQVQWEPVRTLDEDQNIMTMGWFPSPLASATDGGATHIGARSEKLMPVIPEDALEGTFDAFRDGRQIGIRTDIPLRADRGDQA